MPLLPQQGPVRALTYAVLLRTTGRGLFLTVSVIFFLNSVGLSNAEVALGMTIAGVAGLFGGLPAGRLSDVVGPRVVTVACSALCGLLICGYGLVHSFTWFAVVASAVAFAEAADSAARGALIGGIAPADRRVEVRAYLRAVTNVGWSLGGLVAGAALALDTREGYLLMVYGCAACYMGGSLLLLRVPRVAPVPGMASGPKWVVLRDRPYAVLALLNALLVMHGPLLMVGVPMWIEHIGAPTLMISVIALTNTVLITLLQVRLSRGTSEVPGAARAQRRAGVLLLLSCGLFALAAGQPTWVAVVALSCGGLLHVFGELLQAAGSWGLSYELAPPYALGQYQGLYGTGQQAAGIAGPSLLTAAVIGWGTPGWLAVGAMFLLAGLAVPPVARWALASARDAHHGPVVGRPAITEPG